MGFPYNLKKFRLFSHHLPSKLLVTKPTHFVSFSHRRATLDWIPINSLQFFILETSDFRYRNVSVWSCHAICIYKDKYKNAGVGESSFSPPSLQLKRSRRFVQIHQGALSPLTAQGGGTLKPLDFTVWWKTPASMRSPTIFPKCHYYGYVQKITFLKECKYNSLL